MVNTALFGALATISQCGKGRRPTNMESGSLVSPAASGCGMAIGIGQDSCVETRHSRPTKMESGSLEFP